MQSRLAWSLFTFLALTAPSLEAAEWQPLVHMDRMLFPSYVIASAGIKRPPVEENDEEVLGDPLGVIGIEIAAPDEDAEIEVTVACDAVMEKSVFKGTLEKGGEDDGYYVFPKIRYKYDELLKNKQARPITVVISVKLDGKAAGEETETITLRSINDCPFHVRHPDDEEDPGDDIGWVFAAYVNEDHPHVDKVLKEALKQGVVDAFTGYQSKSEVETLKQVYAVWHALQKSGLKYSDVSKTSAVSQLVGSQHVRLMDESIAAAQANCVDGTVLLASILRKISIEPFLVLVPGHCYLAFYVDHEQKHLVALETTLIGVNNVEKFDVIENLAKAVDEKFHDETSWANFHAALAVGNNNLKENEDKFKSDKDPGFQLINIAAARLMGVLPIGYSAK